MSKFTVPLVVVASAAIAGAAWQTYQVSEERLRAASLSQDLAGMEKRMADLEKDAARLREQNAIFESESDQLRKRLAGKAGAASKEKAAGEETSDGFVPLEGEQKQPEKQNFMQTMAKMMKDPEMKKAMRSQQAMGLNMMYGDLAKELGLNPEQAAQLMELLTDRQLALSEAGMEMISGARGDAAKMAEAGKAVNASREEHDKQIADLLGPDAYNQFKEYEGSLGERMALNQIQQQFAAKGMALGDSERQSLLSIMAEERRNAPPNPWDPSRANPAEQMKAMQSDETFQRLIAQQKQTNQRVLDRATAFLSPDQINQLRESQEQFMRMQEMGMKMGRQMMQGQ